MNFFLRRKMETKSVCFLALAAIGFFSFLPKSDAVRQYGACDVEKTKNNTCGSSYFRCLSGKCIERVKYCNGYNDCPDNSDEKHCRGQYYSSCPSNPPFVRCKDSKKCIPSEWICNGFTDCPSGDDELNCAKSGVESYLLDQARRGAIQWLYNEYQSTSVSAQWGPIVHKAAVALYLTDPDFSKNDSAIRKELSYELSIQLLSRLALKKLQDVSSTDLASFVNGLLVTCLDPRQFYGIDLIKELRKRVDSQNYTNPNVLLALCNAGDTITALDKKKLTDTFWSTYREFWTETQALAVMALSCAQNQDESTADSEIMSELIMELKQRQYRNGTVENLQTTALVMQAIYSAEFETDPDNFDEKKALQQILASVKPDGSFGSFMKTYYVLPVLGCKSLLNISSSHCETTSKREENVLYDLANHKGPKIRVQYSTWIGDQRDMERTLTLKVLNDTSFYGVMELAADIDSKYRFEYVVKNRKPYINAISGLLDDPEGDKFWFFYKIEGEKPVLIQTSPADVKPKDNEHLVMWYRSGSWIE